MTVHTTLPSHYQIGDKLRLHPAIGCALAEVVGISYTISKVTYDLQLKIGGEVMRNVDSVFVADVTEFDLTKD